MRSCRSCKLTTTLRALQQYQSHQPHQPHGPGGQPPRQHFSQKLGVDGRKVSNDSYQKRAVRGGNPAGEQLLQFIAEKVSGCCDLMVVMVVMVVAMTMMMTMMMVMMVVVMMMMMMMTMVAMMVAMMVTMVAMMVAMMMMIIMMSVIVMMMMMMAAAAVNNDALLHREQPTRPRHTTPPLVSQVHQKATNVRVIFRSFDTDKSGKLHAGEFRRVSTAWNILQYNRPDHLGLWRGALPEHQMALITSNCVPSRPGARAHGHHAVRTGAPQPLVCGAFSPGESQISTPAHTGHPINPKSTYQLIQDTQADMLTWGFRGSAGGP